MNQHTICLRAANPTIDEGLVFARYLDVAAEGFFRFMLGHRVAEILATAYTQPNNDYSFENVVFSERDGIIVGMASGFAAEKRREFSEKPLRKAAGKSALRMTTVEILLAPLFRILETVADADFYLLAVAVDKELRGEGIGSMLVDEIEDRAISNGSARLALDVSAKNAGARKLYERRGMIVESEWPKLMFVPPVFVRMTKTL